ncbi:MAG TPA: mannose-6-phosphate isomerase, class I [Chitinophagaceae bacterium]|nr:mannose-6-phosphate isomerase, class I [Chitinophagaceae bacterium]
MAGIAQLTGTVKHYDWGGFSFIPSLLKTENPDNKPFAEYWLGVHPLGISQVQFADGNIQPLSEYAGHLPFLLKVLDVKDMLSIQVHPSKSSAEEEFARENREGIPTDSPRRNYKDDNHKPEMLVALSDFYLLHGFKTAKMLNAVLQVVPELSSFLPLFASNNYDNLYRTAMTMSQEQVNQILRPLIDRIVPLYKENKLGKDSEDFWAARAATTFSKNKNIDRGIFSIYFFNLVHLKKGEAIFQGAGLPHAYLEGQNVELMSNSDNVLRGGLTTKHIDVEELLKHVKCEPTVPAILEGKEIASSVRLFKPPVKDFQLSVSELAKNETLSVTANATEIILLTEGDMEIPEGPVILKPGQPVAVALKGTTYTLKGLAGKSTVFRASEAVHNG